MNKAIKRLELLARRIEMGAIWLRIKAMKLRRCEGTSQR